MSSDPRRIVSWQLQFGLLSAIWGSSFLFIKVLDRHWPPLWVALGRVSLGALTLVVIVRASGGRLSRDLRLWAHCAVVAVLSNAIPFTLFAYGEQHVSSIVAGLWNATTPVWVLALSLIAFREQRATASRVAGMLVGFAGVALLLGPWRAPGHGAMAGQLACAVAAGCYGLTFLYTRRHLAPRAETGPTVAAAQLICATAILALFMPLSRGATGDLGWAGIASLLGLGILSSGVAFVLNFAIVRARGAARASTVTYLMPVVSTVLGFVALDEPVQWNQPVGALVLLGGIAAAHRGLPIRSLAAGALRPRAGQVR